ncbi:MAG: hypothetical protein K6E84_10270 [Lachnospiraceae bacterium]|nr:hypothetical protein [Lachnospiraceae bacterium]
MDEFGILSGATYLIPKFWQNYLTSVFYIFALMLIPIPAGVIIVQEAVISLLAAHVLCLAFEHAESDDGIVDNSSRATRRSVKNDAKKQEESEKKEEGKNAGKLSKSMLLLLIPLVMLPVLDSNAYPMRMNIWAFLELTLLSKCYFLAMDLKKGRFKENTPNNASQVSKSLTALKTELSDNFSTTDVLICGKLRKNLVSLCGLAAVVTVWRTEAVYYLILFPILLFIIRCYEKMGRKESEEETRIKVGKYIAIYLCITIVLFAPQKVGEKFESGDQYELTGMVLPIVPLVKEADRVSSDKDKELLATVDRVLNVELILEKEKEGKNGINMFWGEPEFQRDYSADDFAAFRSAYYSLVIKYPAVFLKERFQTFCESHDLLMDTTKLHTDMDNPNHAAFAQYPLSAPMSDTIRSKVICLLELRSQSSYDKKLLLADPVYSATIPILVLAALLAAALIKKKWMGLAVTVCSLIKVPLVFLTAPSRLFMYYYPVYLVGYFALFYVLSLLLTAGAEKR